jgi:hypothetical protein
MTTDRSYLLFLLVIFICSCNEQQPDAVFTKLSKRTTGIDFRNLLIENEDFNIFKYQYFNNGGGLAVGDFNNDGLQDLVFTGNMVKNRLYLNKGDFRFKDITKKSGIAEKEGWCTGVTPVDINHDGWLDLYICRTAYPFKELRKNLLFINNGGEGDNITFTESAADYGLDDSAFSTQSAFFDYDRDGDLDLLLLNHSTVEYSRGSLEVLQLRKKKNPDFTNKLFRNDNGQFVNVTEAAGITSNVLTFSLGLSVADLNNDHWPDLYIGNDFNEPDYLFINQKDGTFSEEFDQSFDHSSMFSMGSDVADINNDGLLDLVNLDMLPESNYAQKMHSGIDNYDKVSMLQKAGFSNQYSRNMLQINNGDGTFSEVSQLVGVSNTDWSWAPLFFDFDNDGKKDLFIANGYPRDHTDMDFLTFTANEVIQMDKGKDPITFEEYMAQMPPILLPNYFFKNKGNLGFVNKTADWGLDEKLVSQSAVYADLDNDGDLDLVLNNTEDYAAVYQNNSDRLFQNHYLKTKLKGSKRNPSGIGAKLSIFANGKLFVQEQQPIRGFQSSVDPILNFGLGQITRVDSLVVVWPRGEREVLKDVSVNQLLELNILTAKQSKEPLAVKSKTWLSKKEILPVKHKENNINDFKYQSLLPWFLSREGPAIASGDVNRDGRVDLYLGNAKASVGQLLLQEDIIGSFEQKEPTDFEKDAGSEDTGAVFFDADQDGDLDLYVASGGYEFPENDALLQDRLYKNDGLGNFVKTKNALPDFAINSSCVISEDIDQDGDLDLFVGGGYIHRKYPESYQSQLLINNGNGVFEKQELAKNDFGNVTDAIWLDLNKDGFSELIVVGDWSRVRVFENSKGVLEEKTDQYFKGEAQTGLWNAIHTADFDGDGDMDLVVGNLGNNSQLKVTREEPLELFYGDFDDNGSVDPLLCYYENGKSWPFVSRDDLIGQLPHLKKKYLHFKDYANAQIQDILTPEQLAKAKKEQVFTLETSYFENTGSEFIKKEIPVEAQIAPVHAIESLDLNGDGYLDLLLAGNNLHTRVKLGRLDGSHGLVLLGNGKGRFRKASYQETGLKIRGATKQIEKVEIGGQLHLLFGVNDEAFEFFEIEK